MRRMTTFGTANVSFGKPLSLREFSSQNDGATVALAGELMSRIAEVVPLVPVPLVCRALLAGAKTPADIAAHIEADFQKMPRNVRRPQRDAADLAADGIAILQRRNLVSGEETLTLDASAHSVLSYYASSIAHHFPEPTDGDT